MRRRRRGERKRNEESYSAGVGGKWRRRRGMRKRRVEIM